VKRLFYITIILLTGMVVFSCSGQQEKFSVRGEFTGLNDLELYFWTPEGGHGKVDTVYVRNGRFAYESPQSAPGWYTMLFQNMSEQVIFAEPGLDVEIEADATHLRDMKIKGGKANKLMTKFREQIGSDASIQTIIDNAREFIEKNPESIVSVYLFEKYFLQRKESDMKQISQLLDILVKAQPDRTRLIGIQNRLEGRQKMNVGVPAPDFHVRDMQGVEHDLASYKDSTLLLCFWANWHMDSRDDLRPMHKEHKGLEKKVSILTVSLDLMKVSWRTFLRIDSVPGTHVCDLQAWESPIVKAYGINELPTYILVKDGKIIARENSLKEIEGKIN
jgi:hypothetical protein